MLRCPGQQQASESEEEDDSNSSDSSSESSSSSDGAKSSVLPSSSSESSSSEEEEEERVVEVKGNVSSSDGNSSASSSSDSSDQEEDSSNSLGEPSSSSSSESSEEEGESEVESKPIATTKGTKKTCTQCGKQVVNLSSHNLVHLPREFFCRVCKLSFTTAQNLKQHCATKTHNDRVLELPRGVVGMDAAAAAAKFQVEKEGCEKCGKMVAKNWLSGHLKTHLPKQHHCEACGLSFASERSYKEHLETDKHLLKEKLAATSSSNDTAAGANNGDEQQPAFTMRVPCPVCKKMVARSNLRKHEYTHYPPSCYCLPCAKGFKYKHVWQRHMQSKSHLKRMEIHNNSQSRGDAAAAAVDASDEDERKPPPPSQVKVRCDVCHKMVGKSYLDNHRAIHFPKQHLCGPCNKAYSTMSGLKEHLKTQGHALRVQVAERTLQQTNTKRQRVEEMTSSEEDESSSGESD